MSAPPSAKDQVARLLTLVPYLHARGEVRLDEAAQALGVEPDRLFEDLKVLSSSDASTVRPPASVRSVIFRSTLP